MSVDIQTIARGTPDWHTAMNTNLENIKTGFDQIDSQLSELVVRTNAATFFALSKEQTAAMYATGTRIIVVQHTDTPVAGIVPGAAYLIESDGTTHSVGETNIRNYAYIGKDLSKVFASAAAMHAAVAAGDFSRINIGDYWLVTITGTYKDYGDGATKSLNAAVIYYEVAGIGVYTGYGDNSVPTNSILFCPRDALPNTSQWRSANSTWTDTTVTNPWIGSALYATLNANDGLLPLIKATSIGAYMYTGPNGKGMRFLGETKASTAPDATSWAWVDRGCLFLPSEREVWGQDVWSEHTYGGGLALQWPIFAGSRRHISKGLGHGGSRCTWWCCDSMAGSPTIACYVADRGLPHYGAASTALAVVPCFLFV